MPVANRITELRVASGWSREQVAAHLEVEPTTIYRWETGRSGVPDHRKVQLAQLFKVTVAYLMCWSDGEGDGNNGEVDAA